MSIRLAYEFKKKLLKEKILRAVKYRTIITKEVFSKITFGSFITITSTTLSLAVAALLYLNLSDTFVPFKIPNEDRLQYWGQIGDYIGGILNPLLSFLALMAVLHTIKIQRNELKDAREEAKLSNTIQFKQTEIFERQNFESALFRLFEVHNRLIDRFLSDRTGENILKLILEQIRFELLSLDKADDELQKTSKSQKYYLLRQKEIEKLSKAATSTLEIKYPESLSHYFRNIYQILKTIDEYNHTSDPNSKIPPERQAYFFRRRYSSMFRALLTGDELKILTMNCLTSNGSGMKRYIEKYSILKHLDANDFLKDRSHALDIFSEVAFMDSEKISDSHIARFDFSQQIDRKKR